MKKERNADEFSSRHSALSFLYDMFSAVPAGFPVGIIKAVYADAIAGGDVDELIFSQVDAAM